MKMIAKPILEERIPQLKEDVKNIKGGVKSATIIVGEKPDSLLYVNMKHKKCEEIGICSDIIKISGDISTEELEKELEKIVGYDIYDGILIQLPLPSHINQEYILTKFGDMIANLPNRANKHLIDVDAISPFSRLLGSVPCTPKGIMKLIEYYDIDLFAKHVVVIGRSEIVGKPVAKLCRDKDATVSIVHSRTPKFIREMLLTNADVIISCAGVARLIQPLDVVIGGKTVIDAGVTMIDGKAVGDVSERCYDLLKAYTPYTGAVGPMTILSLLENIVESAKNR